MGLAKTLQVTGLTNRDSEDYGAIALGKEKKNWFCKSLKCTEYLISIKREFNSKTGLVEDIKHFKNYHKVLKVVDRAYRGCPDCGEGLFEK